MRKESAQRVTLVREGELKMTNYWEDETPPDVAKDIREWLEEQYKED